MLPWWNQQTRRSLKSVPQGVPMQVWPGAPAYLPVEDKNNPKEVPNEQHILEIHPCRLRECDLRQPRRRAPEPHDSQCATAGKGSQGSQASLLCGHEFWPRHQMPGPVGRRHGPGLRADLPHADGAAQCRGARCRSGGGGKCRSLTSPQPS